MESRVPRLARRPACRQKGFTLIELVVALVVAAILVNVLFQFLFGQSRFAGLQNAREEVQQNARAGLDLIASELRSVGPLGIATAEANQIVFAGPRAWGLACGNDASGRLGVLFPAAAIPALKNGAIAQPDLLFVQQYQDAANTARPAQVLVISDGTGVAGNLGSARTTCNTALSPNPTITTTVAAQSPARLFVPGPGAIPGGTAAISAGTPVSVVETVTYSVGAAALPGNWILRNGAAVAGPVPVGGLRFRYFRADGTEIPTPVTAAADLAAIQSVQIVVQTQSVTRFNNTPQTDGDSTVVYLRNR